MFSSVEQYIERFQGFSLTHICLYFFIKKRLKIVVEKVHSVFNIPQSDVKILFIAVNYIQFKGSDVFQRNCYPINEVYLISPHHTQGRTTFS